MSNYDWFAPTLEQQEAAKVKAKAQEHARQHGFHGVSFTDSSYTQAPVVHTDCGTVVAFNYVDTHLRYCPAREGVVD